MIAYATFPTIHLGPLRLYTFGLCVAIGVLVGAYLTSRRNEKFGVTAEATQSMVLWLVLAGLAGARLTWVATNWSQIHSPLDVVAVWNGGMQFSGGFIAALLIAPWCTRRVRAAGVPRLMLLDSAMIGLAVGQWIGRVGCISVGEHLGGPTRFFLGWKYLGGPTREHGYVAGQTYPNYVVGQTYHNTAIYEFLWLIPVIAVLLWLARGKRAPGLISGVFLLLYAAGRFGTDFLRIHDKTLAGLTGAQYACLALLPVGVWLLARTRGNRETPPAVSGAEG